MPLFSIVTRNCKQNSKVSTAINNGWIIYFGLVKTFVSNFLNSGSIQAVAELENFEEISEIRMDIELTN